jgi:hypothetical protein
MDATERQALMALLPARMADAGMVQLESVAGSKPG